MRDYKSLFLCYFDGKLCKKNLQDAKNYFYDFFKNNISEESEITRLNELKKFITNPDELNFIEKKIENFKLTCRRNEHIVSEIEIEIQELENKINHEEVLQAVWLKNLLKYYPNQEKYIIKDYGNYINEFAKALNSSKKANLVFILDEILTFADLYKSTILFSIRCLGNTKCKLLNSLKINHALQMGLEAYLMGNLKNDAIIAALLSDALLYSKNPDKLKTKVAKITEGFNGEKVLDIYKKTGQDASLQNKDWNIRKKHQLKYLKTPGTTSFSAITILLISKKINLSEIAKHFENLKESYKNNYPDATSDMCEKYISDIKANFWNEYASISEEEAKSYYSSLGDVFNKLQSIPYSLLKKYEDCYLKVFE